MTKRGTAGTRARRARPGASFAVALAAGLLVPGAGANAAGLDGAGLSPAWALPFAGILASIALGPALAPKLWHRHHGKIALGWALAAALPLAALAGPGAAAGTLAHALLRDYLPFIVLLFALFTMAGGVVIRGNLRGGPAVNAALLAGGALAASVLGTTGASMILIRPLIRANDARRRSAHVVVFFIFLVSNIGGALSPLGDPPLFVGFLRGVDFFWTTRHLALETAFVAGLTLLAFVAVDAWIERRDGSPGLDPTPDRGPLRLRGGINLLLIALATGVILGTAAWKPGVAATVLGVAVPVQDLARDAGLLALAFASLVLTPRALRLENGFDWEPIREVATLFAAIFVCIAPVLAILAAGREGAFAPLLALVAEPDGTPRPAAYFWLTGLLSSVLDNVPTYLVFFEAAGGDARLLMGQVPGREAMAATLAAISSGAVFMGAMTYIGNAPNFMVYAIARRGGVRMPGFFGYMAWSGLVLGPIFLAATLVFFQ